jgi:hypothetical protein
LRYSGRLRGLAGRRDFVKSGAEQRVTRNIRGTRSISRGSRRPRIFKLCRDDRRGHSLDGVSGGLGLLGSFSLNRSNVQTGDDDPALVAEPHHHPTALGIDRGMVGAGDAVTTPAARNNGERLERPSLQKMSNTSDHEKRVLELAVAGKAAQPPNRPTGQPA